MKILYLVEGAAPYGSNKSLIDLIDHVRERGIEPIVAGSSQGPLADWVKQRGIRYYALRHRFSIYPRANNFWRKLFFLPIFLVFRLLNLAALFKLLWLCWKLRPDIIHTNIGPISIGYFAARALGIKHVWHLREFQDLDFSMRFFPSRKAFLRYLNRSERVICVTRSVAAHFCNPPNAIVIYNGVAKREEHTLCMPKEDYFLFAGRLEPTKGIEQVVHAYLEYAKQTPRPLRLLVAGDGEQNYLEKLKSLTSGDPIGSNIEFLGFRNDTLALMQKAKALIVASKNEGFGRITAEAMFNGCLVIGKNTGGTAELLDASQTQPLGLLFDSHGTLVLRLLEAAGMADADYANLVAIAQAKAINNYCTEQYGSRVFDVYKNLLGPDSAS